MRAREILNLVSGALQDLEPDCERRFAWTREEGRVCLLDFLNAACRAICTQRPDACAATETIRLGPGMRQRLSGRTCREPLLLIELVRNMGACGDCPGPAILPVRQDILMAWACAGREGAIIENYALDRAASPESYLVYPAVPSDRDVYVEATFGALPCPVNDPDQETGLSGRFADAIGHHMLAAIFAGDNEASSLEKAGWHQNMFSQLLGTDMRVQHGWPKAKSSGAG